MAAPYAAMVMDARSGKVLHAENADTRLHPASLTKMMTLYIAFEAVQNGELSMDTVVSISRNATAEPPSKLGLRTGQKMKMRYLVRAAAVKSANDAATAIGEAISGSEAAFARRMTRTAKALGMTRTTFKNAHGLTESGHLSTARDMTILGRHMLYDYPQYYNLFSRRATDAGMKTVYSHNKLLVNYRGADGIKTGYTRAAGFNLVASAVRGRERVIATVFGGRSSSTRDKRVAELLDLGFKKAQTNVALNKPNRPAYMGNQGLGPVEVAKNADASPSGATGKSVRVVAAAVTRSLRPQLRPGAEPPAVPDTAPLVAEVADDITTALEEVQVAEAEVAPTPPAEDSEKAVAAAAIAEASGIAPGASVKPMRRPQGVLLASAGGTTADEATAEAAAQVAQKQEVVTRVSTSGGRHWGINVGRYPSRYAAEKVLLKTALMETSSLDGSLRKVVGRSNGFDANFMGLSREGADLACRRLQARQVTCFMIGPS
ncbi:D-alanyl-D-alanine carboxypeptidase family protein [Salipiger mucosus]|nr:D-alanyl-D-alanine carboxypeptidase family protein [Salipiger mucosus]